VTPQAADSVQILNTHVVTIDADPTVTSVTIDSGGTLTEDSSGHTLTVGAGWTNNGTFTAVNGAVKFRNNQTITGSTTFYDLEFNTNGNNSFTIAAGTFATSTGTVVFSGSNSLNLNTGNLDILGNLEIANTNASGGGTATISFLGGGTQTLTSTASSGQGELPHVVINKSGGSLSLVGIISVQGSWTYTGGTVTPGTSTVAFTNGNKTITGSLTLTNLEFNPGGSNTIYTIASGTTLTVNGDLALTSTGLLALNTGAITLKGDLTQSNPNTSASSGGTAIITLSGDDDQTIDSTAVAAGQGYLPNLVINKSTGTLFLKGAINLRGGWTRTAGTVDSATYDNTVSFYSTATITGSTTFKNLTFDSTAANRTFTIAAGTYATSTGTLTLSGSTVLTLNTGNLDVQGDLVVSNTSQSSAGGTATISIVGTGTQTFTGPGTLGEGRLPNIVINKSSGDLNLAGNITAAAGWTYLTAGSVDPGTSTVAFSTNANLDGQGTSDTMSFNDLTIISGVRTLTGDLDVNGDLTFLSTAGGATLYNPTAYGVTVGGNWTNDSIAAAPWQSGANTTTFDGSGDSIIVTGGTDAGHDFNDLIIAKTGSGVVQLSTNGLDVDGTLTIADGTLDLNGQDLSTTASLVVNSGAIWKLNGTETVSDSSPQLDSGSTVEFAGAGDATVANYAATYHHLKSTTAGKTLIFPADTTTTVNGTLTLEGANGNNIILKSSAAGTDGEKAEDEWDLAVAAVADAEGNAYVEYVTVYDSDATGAATPITQQNSTDGGNNTGWSFNETPTVTTLGPTALTDGSYTTDTTPTLTFTTADADADTVAYELTVDDTSSFSSPVYQATSTYAAAGAVSTTTAALPDGSYYWRVLVGDGTATSSYATANSGSVAFILDTTAPTPSSISSGTPDHESATITWTTVEGATSQVEYGLDTNYGTYSALDAGPNTSHSVALSGLDAETTYHYRVASVDPAGNAATSSDQTFTTAATPDTTDPTVSLTSPAAAAALSGTVVLTASASDNVAVAGVQFKRDTNTLIGAEVTSAPYLRSWDTTALSDGSQTLLAVARDTSGNYATSTGVTVTVDNTAPTAGTLTLSEVAATTVSATTTGASDATAGLAAAPFRYHNVTLDTYAAATAVAITFADLTPNTAYQWETGVVDLAGNWATTTAVATTTLANPPTTLALVADSSTQITASWSANGNPAGTEYYVENVTAGTNSGWLTTTSHSFTALTPDTTYLISVKARNADEVETSAISDSLAATVVAPEPEAEPASGGSSSGGRRRLPAPVAAPTTPTPALLPRLIYQIPLVADHGIDVVRELFRAEPEPDATEPILPAIEEVVKSEAPLAFRSVWDLIPAEPLQRFVFAPLPADFARLTAKFPGLDETLAALDVETVGDLTKLQTARLHLPGLTRSSQLTPPTLSAADWERVQSVPLAELTPNLKANLPTGVVFVRSSDERVDLSPVLTVDDQGVAEQRVNTVVNQPLVLAVKPSAPVNSVTGYLVLKSRASGGGPSRAALPFSDWVASPFLALTALAEPASPLVIDQELVVGEFNYADPDDDGIYTALVEPPQVAGEYEVITVLDYQDESLGRRLVRLVTVVDPEGYIYEPLGGKELRVNGATATLWQRDADGQWLVWPAANYSQENPQITDVSGSYSFLVPPGTYRLTVTAPGYDDYEGTEFPVQVGRGVHQNIALKAHFNWRTLLDWRSILLILVAIGLLYHFIRPKIKYR
jgi:hypothetical protein